MIDPALQGSALIGPVGGLIRLHGSSSVDVTTPERLVKTTGLGGRAVAQRLPAGQREWSVNVDSAYPEHVALLRALDRGPFGPGPFVWYDELAQSSNILTPAQGWMEDDAWTGGMFGGAGSTVDGKVQWLSSRVAAPGQAMGPTEDVPVPAGVPVSTSAYISTHPATTATLRVIEIDPQGAQVGDPWQATIPPGTFAARPVISRTTSLQTVALRIFMVSPLMVTMPAVSLTTEALPWTDGMGCTTAVFDLTGHSVRKAVPAPRGRRIGYPLTVHELG